MCELALKWDYVMQMSWKEYQLRLDGYLRMQKEDYKKFRMVAYQVYASTPMKNKPVSIEKYLPLDDKVKPVFNDEMKDKIRQEYEKFKKKWQMS